MYYDVAYYEHYCSGLYSHLSKYHFTTKTKLFCFPRYYLCLAYGETVNGYLIVLIRCYKSLMASKLSVGRNVEISQRIYLDRLAP